MTHRHPAHFTYTPVMPVELVRDGLSREKLRHTIIQQHRKNTTKVILPPFEPLELELELMQTQMAQKPMLRAEVGMRVRCANKVSVG